MTDTHSGNSHVGVKHVFELVPPGLVKRMKEDRKTRLVRQDMRHTHPAMF